MQRTIELSKPVLEALGENATTLAALMDGLSYVWRVAVMDNERVLDDGEWYWLRSVLREAVINPRQHPGELITSAIDEAVTYRLVAMREEADPDQMKQKIGSLDRFQSLVLLYTLVQHDVDGVEFWKLERRTEARRSAIAKLERRRTKQGRRADSDRSHHRGAQGTPQAIGTSTPSEHDKNVDSEIADE